MATQSKTKPSKQMFPGGWTPVDVSETRQANKQVGDLLNGLIRMGFVHPEGGAVKACLAFKDEETAEQYMWIMAERIQAQSCVRARLAAIEYGDLLPGERAVLIYHGDAVDEAEERTKNASRPNTKTLVDHARELVEKALTPSK
jgi:hypothetical protein